MTKPSARLTYAEIINRLQAQANPANVAGMARFGIKSKKVLGVPSSQLQNIAREIGRDHDLAARLWASGIREGRLLACLVDIPAKVTGAQMDSWVRDFDSWDVCDGCCIHLFSRTELAYPRAQEWSTASEEFIKRAGFVLIAVLAVHDKDAEDRQFEQFFNIIKIGAVDNRNLVKKAVNWALRQIGKRNLALNRKALGLAEEIRLIDTGSARWIAADAIRELRSPAVQARLKLKAGHEGQKYARE